MAKNSLKDYFSSGLNRKRWEEAKEKAKNRGSFGEYDDGKYTAKIISATVTRSEGSGRLQHVFGFKFTEGEYKGQTTYQYQGVENDIGIEVLIATMKKLGHDIDSPEDIEDIADKKIAKEQPEVLIRLKTNGEYQNVIVLKKTEKDEEEPVEDDEDEDEKEVEEDEDEEEEETEAKDSDEDEEEEKPASKKVEKKKAPKEEVEEDEEEEEESEDEDEDEEKASDDAEPELEVGQTLLVKVDDKEFKAKLLEIVEERKDGTGIVRVKSLKDGKKYRIEVPDDVVEIVK